MPLLTFAFGLWVFIGVLYGIYVYTNGLVKSAKR